MNGSKFNFNSDTVNVITLVYDTSGSMESDVFAIRQANRAFQKDFSRFEEKNSIVISKCCFNESISMSDFLSVDFFNTGYSACGGTKLYKAITYAAMETLDYCAELTKRLNIQPRITFLVFSDGCDSYGYTSELEGAKNSVKQLNSSDATTVFVAFREAIRDNTGEKLGFTCTRNISTVQELISCLGTELSQSCKEQSRSAYSLKSAFFSKATPTTQQEAEDETVLADSFFDV